MEMITERQKIILDKIVEEYIGSAQPISSSLLEKKHGLGISPATIRIEMQKLTEDGFIFQPHTSAGRVPTDKGYRLFVNELLQKETAPDNDVFGKVFDGMENKFRLTHELTKLLAENSSNLALSYLSNEKIFWKEGWEMMLKEPEFKESKMIAEFADFLKFLERVIESDKIDSEMEIFIGRENPFIKADNFSMIISRCSFPKREEGVLAIIGPKRMSYKKNINSLKSIVSLLDEF